MATSVELYPSIRPHKKYTLNTGDGHKVYFEECGNPNGLPVLFFHGGPGAGCSPKDRRYFDPKKYRVILFDQRGCGRSRPISKLEHNTTWHLVKDAKCILDKLKIQEVILFGGSWGSTMALAFAIAYPETVLGMVLRGIFLGEPSEIDYSENGLIAQHFPEAWERFASVLPMNERNNPLEGYYKRIVAEPVSPVRTRKLAHEWTRYEDIHLRLTSLPPERLEKEFNKYSWSEIRSCAILEIYYLRNGCFFVGNNFILKNTGEIPNVPISIIHGKYDVICPPRNAYRLENALATSGHNQVRTFFTFAGHSKSDPENQKRLLLETDLMYDKVRAAS